MRYVYLHGFASGPTSRKAEAFRTALAKRGIMLEIPDLAECDFENLTISGQLNVVERLLDSDPGRVIGSSMGGYLAALYAAKHPEIDRLVLLAPAFGFATRWHDLLGAEKLSDWKRTGSMDVFHYGQNALRPLSYKLFEDAQTYPPSPAFFQPAQLFHGLNDVVVPISFSRDFARTHPNAKLTELDSDHELTNALNRITEASVPFLIQDQLTPPAS